MKKILLFLIFFFVGLAYSDRINNFISEAESKVSMFLWWAIVSAVLAIFIAIINLISTSFDNQKYKKTSLAIAIINVILVFANENIIEGDYKTLMHKKNMGDKLIGQIEIIKYDFDNEEDQKAKEEYKKQIFEKIIEIEDLNLNNEKNDQTILSQKNSFWLPFISNAYAQANHTKKLARKVPEWVEKLPENRSRLYYVGYGMGESLDEAKLLSKFYGVEMGSRVLTASLMPSVNFKDIPTFFDSLKTVVGSSRVDDVYFRLNKKTKKYEYFILYYSIKPTLGKKIAISQELSKSSNIKNIDTSIIGSGTWNNIAMLESKKLMENLRAKRKTKHPIKGRQLISVYAKEENRDIDSTNAVLASISSGDVKKITRSMDKVKKEEQNTTGPTFLNLLYGKFLISRGECSPVKKYLKEKQIETYLSFTCKTK